MTGLKLGISGAGFIARFQAVAMRQVRGIEFAGVTQHRRSHEVVKLAKDLGLGEPRIYKSVGEMAKNVDCLAIYSPNFSRISVMEEIVAAVKGGAKLKGVICEKPLGRSVAEARRLVELAQSANLRTAYFENQIFMKPLRAQLLGQDPASTLNTFRQEMQSFRNQVQHRRKFILAELNRGK